MSLENHLMYEINKTQQYITFECKLAGGVVFEFTRYDNLTRFIDDPDVTSRYIINCNIKNNIGVTIYSFKMNESDTMRFIDNAANFLYYFTDTGSSMYIGLPITNSTNEHYPSFEFINTSRFCSEDEIESQNPRSVYINQETGECRYFDLTVYDSCINYRDNQIIKIPMSCSELEDLMFQICLTANVDFGTWLDENNFDESPLLLW